MSITQFETAAALAALWLASSPLRAPAELGVSDFRVPPALAFALLSVLGAASLVFGIRNPELIAATYFAG